MSGELRGSVVVIEDEPEANRVHNKGYPGIPLSGGSLKLGLLEAAFLMDEKGFELSGNDVTSLVELFHHAGRYIRDFEVQYIVYWVLKLRGFFVKIPDHHFDERDESPSDTDVSTPAPTSLVSASPTPTPLVPTSPPPTSLVPPSPTSTSLISTPPIPTFPLRLLPRGSRPSVPASIHVLAISERTEFSIDRMIEFARDCHQKDVEGLAGVVDEDGDVTFYSIRITSPEGDCEVPDDIHIKGKLGQNRVLIPLDGSAGSLLTNGFFGQSMGSMVNLSLIEAIYLMERGILTMEGTSTDTLMDTARNDQPDVDLRYPAYHHLRERGVRVKTGFKYGTHFRAYSRDPDNSHADHLVHTYPDGSTVDWQEISRGIRVAHGVNKRILFTSPALVADGEFLELAWGKALIGLSDHIFCGQLLNDQG